MCIDPTLSVALGDKPPPLYICEECSQRIGGYVFVSPVFISVQYVASPSTHPLLPTSLFCTLTQGKYVAMVT